jgi:hypothetical protein
VAGVWIRHVNPHASDERLADAKALLGADRVVSFEHASELERALGAMGN